MARRDRSKTPASATKDAQISAAELQPRSIAWQVSWFALLATIAIVPVIISNWSWMGADLPLTYDQFDIIKVFTMRVLLLVSLGGWAWHMFTHGGRIRHTPVNWLILIFLAWVTLSSVLSIHIPTALFGKYRRFEGLLSFITYMVAYFLVLQHADRSARIKTIAQVLFWSGAFVAFYGVAQSLGIDWNQWGALPFEERRAFSTYGNPDLLGGFLMFSTFVSFGLVFSEERLAWRSIYWVGALLNVWCLIIAFTRSAWVGAFVGFIFLLVILVVRRYKLQALDWGFAGTIAALSAFVIAQSLRNPNAVMNFWARVKSIFIFNEGSAKTRFEIWQAARDAVVDRPIFGFGPDTFRLIFPKYKPVEYVKDAGYLSVADNVHNYPLQLATGIGIPGVALFYGIIGWVAVRTARMVFLEEGGSNRWILRGFWVACAAYVVHLLFGLSVTGVSLFLWIAMAVLLAPSATAIVVRRPDWGIIAGVGVSALVIAGIVFQFFYISADRSYLTGRISSGQVRVDNAEKAVRLNPWNDIYRAEIGLAYMDLFIQNINEAFQAQQVGEDTSEPVARARDAFLKAEASLKNTIEFVSWEYDNYVFLSSLYNLGGEYLDPTYYAQAEQTAAKGIEVEPFGPAIRLQRARALDKLGNADEAIKEAAYAVEMDPAFAEGALFLSRMYEQKGDLQKALEVVKALEAYRPGQTGVAERIASLEASLSVQP